MIMKFSYLIPIVLCWLAEATAQNPLTLEEAQQAAEQHFPLLHKKLLAAQTEEVQNAAISTAYLPQLNLVGQATYQSAVTTMPYKTPLPGFDVEPLSKDQYKAVLDFSQLIYDGGNTRLRKDLQMWNRKVEELQVDVQIHALKERINQLYLTALMINAQMSQLDLVDNDLKTGIAKVEAQLRGGTAYRSALSVLQAELLKNAQRRIELEGNRQGLMEGLATLTNLPLKATTPLLWPAQPDKVATNITRIELDLLNVQDSLLQAQQQMPTLKSRPSVSAFGQAGYGRPGYDFLKNEFTPYGMVGLRLRWDISSLYTKKKDEEQVAINRKQLEVQRDNFLLQTRSQLAQQAAEIEKWRRISHTDDAIIALRIQVKEAALSQLENGVITSSEYIREVDAAEQARQQAIVHKLRLLQAIITYETKAGK
jgi:outer membrane protein TolC